MKYVIQLPPKWKVADPAYNALLRKFREKFRLRLNNLIKFTSISEDKDIQFAGSTIDFIACAYYATLPYTVFECAFFPIREHTFWDAINSLSKIVVNDFVCEKYLYRLTDLFDKYIDKVKKLVNASVYAPDLKVIVYKS